MFGFPGSQKRIWGPLALLLTAICSMHGAEKESTISETSRYAHAANCGWIDFRPSAADGVIVNATFLSGKAYSCNLGWIDFGDGLPENGYFYSNTSAGDFGVNLQTGGRLSGWAYSANCGWISFDPNAGDPRIDYLTGTVSGWAHGSNIGWISLATPESSLVTKSIHREDIDLDGIADTWEMEHFHSLSVAGQSPTSDWDHDGKSDKEEYIAGTNPRNPASLIRILTFTPDSARTSALVSFTSSPDRLYRIEHNGEFGSVWTKSNVFTPDLGGFTTRTIPLPGGEKRFVRVAAILPLQP
jgi:hypothetical protein